MQRITFLSLVLLAVTAVAVADVFLKKASASGSLLAAFKSPWMFGALALYLFQIFFFAYLFVSGEQLSFIGIMQTLLYPLVVITAGVFLFAESFSFLQIVGSLLGLAGIILLSIG